MPEAALEPGPPGPERGRGGGAGTRGSHRTPGFLYQPSHTSFHGMRSWLLFLPNGNRK